MGGTRQLPRWALSALDAAGAERWWTTEVLAREVVARIACNAANPIATANLIASCLLIEILIAISLLASTARTTSSTHRAGTNCPRLKEAGFCCLCADVISVGWDKVFVNLAVFEPSLPKVSHHAVASGRLRSSICSKVPASPIGEHPLRSSALRACRAACQELIGAASNRDRTSGDVTPSPQYRDVAHFCRYCACLAASHWDAVRRAVSN